MVFLDFRGTLVLPDEANLDELTDGPTNGTRFNFFHFVEKLLDYQLQFSSMNTFMIVDDFKNLDPLVVAEFD